MIALHCASQQLGAMDQLEEELTCPICCGLFEDPRVLLCSHSFCKKCLEGLLEGNRGPSYRTPFKCPTCRKETPHNGANSLQINYSLRGIVEKFNKIKVLPKMSVCKQHCSQPLNIFCATDMKLICGFCATTEEHRGHKFCSLEDAYEREKEAFEELLRGVESWRSADTLSCLETLQAGKKKALQSVTKDAEKVADYFDKLIGSLECKRNEILSDFETLKLVVMQAYDPEITKLSAALEEQRQALGMAESFRSATDPLCFLQQMQEFREKFRVLKDTPLPSRKDVDVGPRVRNFDVKKWDSLRLREVDKISVPHENGSYRTGSRTAVPRWMMVLSLFLVTLLLILLFLLLLSPHNIPASVTSRIDPLLGVLSLQLTHTGGYLREMTDMCTSLIDAGTHAQTCHLPCSAFLTPSCYTCSPYNDLKASPDPGVQRSSNLLHPAWWRDTGPDSPSLAQTERSAPASSAASHCLKLKLHNHFLNWEEERNNNTKSQLFKRVQA